MSALFKFRPSSINLEEGVMEISILEINEDILKRKAIPSLKNLLKKLIEKKVKVVIEDLTSQPIHFHRESRWLC